MRREVKAKTNDSEELKPHYDFDYTKAKPNRFAKAQNGKRRVYRRRYRVFIRESDGATTVRYISPMDDAVFLEPDVRKYFPDSEAVNSALRGLIALRPRPRRAPAKVEKDLS